MTEEKMNPTEELEEDLMEDVVGGGSWNAQYKGKPKFRVDQRVATGGKKGTVLWVSKVKNGGPMCNEFTYKIQLDSGYTLERVCESKIKRA